VSHSGHEMAGGIVAKWFVAALKAAPETE